jgi:hypothetical protein
MMDTVLDVLSWILLLGGAIFLLVGAIGALRFPDFYTRLHAVSVCDTMGAGLVLDGKVAADVLLYDIHRPDCRSCAGRGRHAVETETACR